MAGSGSTLGPTGSFLLGPTGDNALAGGELIEKKYYFTAGGGNPIAKTIQMSIRHNTKAEKPSINSFTNSLRLRKAR